MFTFIIILNLNNVPYGFKNGKDEEEEGKKLCLRLFLTTMLKHL
jgi:hypothetical protein